MPGRGCANEHVQLVVQSEGGPVGDRHHHGEVYATCFWADVERHGMAVGKHAIGLHQSFKELRAVGIAFADNCVEKQGLAFVSPDDAHGEVLVKTKENLTIFVQREVVKANSVAEFDQQCVYQISHAVSRASP